MPTPADTLIRAITADGAIRAFAISSTRLCERARRVQNSLPAASAALGRVMSATVMLAATIKEGERLSVRVEGDGPVERVFAQATPDGRVRGYLGNPQINPPSRDGKLDVGAAVGRHGTFYVIRDLGLRAPYVGQVPLQSGEIGDDLAYYFAISEQQPSAVGLGVLVAPSNAVLAAGGYIIQPLPGASDEILNHLEQNIRSAPPPSDLILSSRNPAHILDVLLAGMEWQELARITPRWHCGCTRTKSRRALNALESSDLREMLAANEPAIVLCDFCGRRYEFTAADLSTVLAGKERG
jgi:molecular chaperone Hsp33